MRNNQFIHSINEIVQTAKEYGNTQKLLSKLYVIEKISKTGTMFVTAIISSIIAAASLVMLTLAFVYWYGENIGTLSTGFLIAGGFYILLFFLFLLLRKPLVENQIVQKATDILLEDEYVNEEEHE